MIRSKEQCKKSLNDFCRSSYHYHLTPYVVERLEDDFKRMEN